MSYRLSAGALWQGGDVLAGKAGLDLVLLCGRVFGVLLELVL
jgi:hypothetical protein